MVLLALFACSPEPIGTDGETLEVRAPRAGVVSVRGQSEPVNAFSPAVLRGLEPGPHTIEFRAEGSRLTVVDAAGPVVDLGGLLGATPTRRGVAVPVSVRAAPLGGAGAVAIVDGQRYLPTVIPDGWRFQLPSGRPVELAMTWQTAGVVDRIAYRRLASPEEAGGRTLVVVPTSDVAPELAVELPGSPRGWVESELTLGGVRTGLILGGGVAGPREAVALGRPVGAWPGGLWVQATARRPGQLEPVAVAAVHVPPDRDEISLRWVRSDDLAPQPGKPSTALPLERDGPSLTWLETTQSATYLEIDLTGTDGCEDSAWRVVAPADSGALELPVPDGIDPLSMPLINGRVTAVHLGGLDYAALLAPGAAAPEQLPGRLSRVDRRTLAGAWRGSQSCAEHPLAGLYAAPSACIPGNEGDAVLVNRCGAVVSLNANADEPLCGTMRDDRLFSTLGGSFSIQTSGPDFVVERGAGDLVLTAEGAVAIRAEQAIRGDWFRVTVDEQPFSWVDGMLGPSAGDPASLGGGGAVDGPWLTIDEAGTVAFASPRWQFEGRLLSFNGVSGSIRTLASGCAGSDVALKLNEDGTLVLTAIRPGDSADRVTRRRATLSR